MKTIDSKVPVFKCVLTWSSATMSALIKLTRRAPICRIERVLIRRLMVVFEGLGSRI